MQTAAVLHIDPTIVDQVAGSIDVRSLEGTFVAHTATSIHNGTQDTEVERRWDPETNANTVTSNAATTNDRRGWAVPVADMATGDAGNVAWIKAQTLTIDLRVGFQGTGTGDVGENDVYTPRASLWKYNPTTDGSTLIIGGSGSTVSQSAAVAYNDSTPRSAQVVLSVPETMFTSAEVMMIVAGGALACGAGLLGGARTFAVRLATTETPIKLTFATQGLRELAETTGSAAGSATATGSTAKILGATGTAAGVGTVSGVMGAIGSATGTAAGTSTVDGQMSSVAATTGTAAGVATAAGVTGLILGTVGTVEVGGGGETTVRKPIYIFDD